MSADKRAMRRKARKLVQRLQAHLPTPYPVELSFARLPKGSDGRPKHADAGRSSRSKKYLIRISAQEARWDIVADCIIHEWAHARNDTGGPLDDLRRDHGEHWGLEYARCYRVATDAAEFPRHG